MWEPVFVKSEPCFGPKQALETGSEAVSGTENGPWEPNFVKSGAVSGTENGSV